jgi:imidazolonepropionase-like amidohydrolase/AraC-like DNA-binding protein
MRYFLFAALLLIQFSISAQKTALIAKSLIDGTGKVISNPVVIIDSNKIFLITTKENTPKDAKIIDLGNYTLLPGLIDMHVHPNLTTGDYQVDFLKGSSATKALLGLKNVKDLLAAGWTTLRVAGDGDVGYANMEIRNAINKGLFAGPHIYGAAHYISATGGGGDINFFSYEQKVIPDGLIVDGPDEMRKAVRTEIKYGSDWIKLLVTGAMMTAGDNPNNVHFSIEEMKAAVEEAARRNVPVMAHAHAAEGIKLAVKAGVRTIEHGSFIDEEAMDLMIQHGTYLIPTMMVRVYFGQPTNDNIVLSKAVEIAKRTNEQVYQNMKLAFKKGVKFGLGTDDIGWPAVYSAKEFEEYLKLGMTPMQAILCATKINAEILKKDKEIGSIEAVKISPNDNPVNNYSCFLSGMHTKPLKMTFDRFHAFGIQMKPVAVKAIFGIPLCKIRDYFIDGDVLLTTLSTMEDKLHSSESFVEKAQWFENFMLKKINETTDLHTALHLDKAIKNILIGHHQNSSKSIENLMGYSRTQTYRLFNDWFGMSAHSYQKLSQFIRSVEGLHNKSEKLFDVGLNNGYYDQAHFIRSFQEFADMTPGEYRKQMTGFPGQILR